VSRRVTRRTLASLKAMRPAQRGSPHLRPYVRRRGRLRCEPRRDGEIGVAPAIEGGGVAVFLGIPPPMRRIPNSPAHALVRCGTKKLPATCGAWRARRPLDCSPPCNLIKRICLTERSLSARVILLSHARPCSPEPLRAFPNPALSPPARGSFCQRSAPKQAGVGSGGDFVSPED